MLGPNLYLERLKTLFWLSVSNFVFPVLLNVVQLVLILRDNDFERGVLVLMVNNYLTIIGVLLATIWASGSEADQRASSRWMVQGADRSPRAPFALLGEKDPDAFFGKGRPRSAPPIRRNAVVVHREEPVEISPSLIV